MGAAVIVSRWHNDCKPLNPCAGQGSAMVVTQPIICTEEYRIGGRSRFLGTLACQDEASGLTEAASTVFSCKRAAASTTHKTGDIYSRDIQDPDFSFAVSCYQCPPFS